MPITSVNPILAAAAAQAVERDLVLQPGTVIDAQVLKVLANNMVRIAISGLSLDVMSQVPRKTSAWSADSKSCVPAEVPKAWLRP